MCSAVPSAAQGMISASSRPGATRRKNPSEFISPAAEGRPMIAYIARRLLFMVPTLFGILLINFGIVQFAPGGPVERILAQLQGLESGATAHFGAASVSNFAAAAEMSSKYRGAQGL